MIPPEEITIDIPGLTLAARAWGPADGRKVLALHGWLDNAATFDGLAPLLDSGLRLVSLDLPGHGRSEHRHASASYDFIYWITDVAAAAAALGWERYSLLAHSLGGSIALCLAGTLPDHVERAVIVDSLGPLVTDAEGVVDRLARGIADIRRQAVKKPGGYPDVEAAVKRRVRVMPGLSEEAARVLVQRGSRRVDDRVFWRHDPRLQGRSLLRLTEQQVGAFLEAVTCPVLLVRPDGGWPVDHVWAKGRLDRIGDLTVEQVQGGHHVHLTDPARVAGPINEFLVEVGAGFTPARAGV